MICSIVLQTLKQTTVSGSIPCYTTLPFCKTNCAPWVWIIPLGQRIFLKLCSMILQTVLCGTISWSRRMPHEYPLQHTVEQKSLLQYRSSSPEQTPFSQQHKHLSWNGLLFLSASKWEKATPTFWFVDSSIDFLASDWRNCLTCKQETIHGQQSVQPTLTCLLNLEGTKMNFVHFVQWINTSALKNALATLFPSGVSQTLKQSPWVCKLIYTDVYVIFIVCIFSIMCVIWLFTYVIWCAFYLYII